MRRVTALAAGAAAFAGALIAAPGAGGATLPAAVRRQPSTSVVFNVPSGSVEEQNAIASHIDALAAGTPRGALIRIAVYRFTSPAFAQTLLDASERGVRIQLVLDASARHSATYRRLAAALGTVRGGSSWVTACNRGCVGDRLMHDKFFLFSRTGSESDVIVQSSANLTTTNRVNAWNNAVTFSDARLYRAYGRYFAALAARRHYAYHATRSGHRTLSTFPRAGRTQKSDTLYTQLGHVGCAARTSVHVTAFSLTRAGVARRLWSLAHQGCDVRVIYTNLGKGARRILRRKGGPRMLSSHYSYFDLSAGDEVEAYVHSKYVAIGGTYAGHGRRLVITGSPNYTVSGLRHNDEATLAIEDASVYGAYESNFLRLWRTVANRLPLGGHVPEK
ncbi:phospholipase D-like domain-containing protein [Actinomadura sp. DC4]|uniref:phospholipase D-like domain-containing protein n=1 Tax=Actinomadura sp. DC4 TaxID=3055069 RepID=UPI0025B02CE5|nr:phospholipase D-like domain-containing protein [Actinomadura sp. DC4]MDN3356748.1 phospholipase D-like domain-containing protein [Actinomadura sp. DC4]